MANRLNNLNDLTGTIKNWVALLVILVAAGVTFGVLSVADGGHILAVVFGGAWDFVKAVGSVIKQAYHEWRAGQPSS